MNLSFRLPYIKSTKYAKNEEIGITRIKKAATSAAFQLAVIRLRITDQLRSQLVGLFGLA